MDKDLHGPIAYLQATDFDDNGNVVNPNIPKDKPMIIMIQSSWCGHCMHAKPAYQNFANNNKNTVFCATIAADGSEEGEEELAQKFSKGMKGIVVRGFPTYVGVKKNGEMLENNIGRDEKSLQQFVNLLKN